MSRTWLCSARRFRGRPAPLPPADRSSQPCCRGTSVGPSSVASLGISSPCMSHHHFGGGNFLSPSAEYRHSNRQSVPSSIMSRQSLYLPQWSHLVTRSRYLRQSPSAYMHVTELLRFATEHSRRVGIGNLAGDLEPLFNAFGVGDGHHDISVLSHGPHVIRSVPPVHRLQC